jgi:uncharacterized membrane protein YbhN (UPF0104 family)
MHTLLNIIFGIFLIVCFFYCFVFQLGQFNLLEYLWHIQYFSVVWGSYAGDYKEYYLSGCDAA